MKAELMTSEQLVEILSAAFETGVQWASVFVRDGTELNAEAKADLSVQYKKEVVTRLKKAGKL